MIITQQYNSIHEIDPEFIPSLEELLADEIPDIHTLEDYEKSTPEDISINYYLFFGGQTNAPIGFAQVELKKTTPIKRSFFERILNKDELEDFYKVATWKIPGAPHECVAFSPRYQKYAEESIQQLFSDLNEREDITDQIISTSRRYQDYFKAQKPKEYKKIQRLDALFKSYDNYQEYLSNLAPDLRHTIFKGFKQLQVELGLSIGEYDQFKESFAYKSEGAKQYKEYKNHPIIKKIIEDEEKYQVVTLESKERIKAMAIVKHRRSGHSFYHILIQDTDIKPIMVHQLAIMSFYGQSNTNQLHLADSYENLSSFTDLGFQVREQLTLNFHKEQ